jgi:splicing factor 45
MIIFRETAPVKRDHATFAARMMAKHGYVPGQGLGANADGIVEPIILERTAAPKAGKKGDVDGDGKPKKGGTGAMGMMGIRGTNMGRIVNSQAEEKIKADLARYGESSRIVVLSNMVALEDVDDDLQGEIGRWNAPFLVLKWLNHFR